MTHFGGDVAHSNAESLTLSRQYQSAIAQCMADRGWSYTAETPYDPTTDHGQEFATSADGPIHGYGVVQEYEIARAGSSALPPGPNADIVSSLNEDESAGYNIDLYGRYGPDGREIGTPGCSQVASAHIRGSDPSFWGVRGGDAPSNDDVVDLRERETQLCRTDHEYRESTGVDVARVAAESVQVQQPLGEFPELDTMTAESDS